MRNKLPNWRPDVVVLTCEHAGREVPVSYRALFKRHRAALNSHLGYDIGAIGIATQMAASLSAPLVFTNTTRLLIDTNRSLEHPCLFSSITSVLAEDERRKIINRFYRPYRSSVERLIEASVKMRQRVLHIGVHSFTDVLDGVSRDVDIGLLFDPGRRSESLLCRKWSAALAIHADHLRHRFNEPYHGIDDGLTSMLRTKFADHAYAGLEVEVRQGLIGGVRQIREIADLLTSRLIPLLQRDVGESDSGSNRTTP